MEAKIVEALRALVRECEAEFTVDGEWSDTGQLVRKSTFNRARSALSRVEQTGKRDEVSG